MKMQFEILGTKTVSMHVAVDETCGKTITNENAEISNSTTSLDKNACFSRAQLTSLTSGDLPKIQRMFHIGNQCTKLRSEKVTLDGIAYEKYTSYIQIQNDADPYEISCLVKTTEEDNIIYTDLANFDENLDSSKEVELIVTEGKSDVSIEMGEILTLSLNIKQPVSNMFYGSLTKCYGSTNIEGKENIIPLIGFNKGPGCIDGNFVWWNSTESVQILNAISFKGKLFYLTKLSIRKSMKN